MRLRLIARCGLAFVWALGLSFLPACQTQEPDPTATPAPAGNEIASRQPPPEPLKNEIPAAALADVMSAHFQGLGHMERFEYREAAEAFRHVRNRAPGWIPGSINLAIALLNDSGVQAEQAKKAGGGETAPNNFDEALALLAGVLEREPASPHAHFCRGIILEQQGRLVDAHRHFKRVTEIDPYDAAAWFWTASTVTDPSDPNRPAGPEQAKEQIGLLEKSLELDPYLTPALYKLAFAYVYAGQQAKQKDLLARWSKINPDRPGPTPGPGDVLEKNYGYMGKYATAVNPYPLPQSVPQSAEIAPKFEAARPLLVTLPDGERWTQPADFKGSTAVIGRIRGRFGAAVAAFDANGDGRLDLFLTSAVVRPDGTIRDALLLNEGDGRFEDASARFGLPKDRASVGVAAADFDADRQIDVFLTGVGENRLLHNRGGSSFEDISKTLQIPGPKTLSLMARWLDLDQDGDLDLYVVNYCAAEHADKAFTASGETPPGAANMVFRNDGRPEPVPGRPEPTWAPAAVISENSESKKGLSVALSPWSGDLALAGGQAAHAGIASLDIDNDRDLDLVLVADGAPTVAILNDRLGQFHQVVLNDLAPTPPASGLLVIDLDADGRADLAAPSAGGLVYVWRNKTERTTMTQTSLTFEPWPTNASRWRAAQAIDLDLDGRTDLLGLLAPSSKVSEFDVPLWARNERALLSTKTLPVQLESPGLDGLIAVDLVGDPLPDILAVRPGSPPVLARNLGNGRHWLAFELGGLWHVKPELMRTNSHGLGTRVLVEGQGTHVTHEHTTQETGLGQSVVPFVLGLGERERAELIHLRWPDGVMQCELNVTGDQKLSLVEKNRKTGSCPVLFTWNGRRFVCIGDFLGGGGLGYLVAPGVYGQPDRDEAIAVTAEQLQLSNGVLRISITEPMDEVAYLDHLRLDAVDCPPGVSATPDERFAPDGTRPTGELIAWRAAIAPVRATDLEGRDLTETLRFWDRRTADSFRKRDGWIGYSEEHAIILDFGDRLSHFGPSDRLVLCLAGWVEYPYSQTNYAAATAGVTLLPPAIERRREDGRFETIERNAGYPAGMPRLMTVDLTGKLTGPNCVLRIKTNMECYYDQAFIVARDPVAESSLRVSSLPVARADLGHRGYTREISPDGGQPLIYDYDYVDPAPLASFAGKLTRYGDVAPLLRSDDDQLCLVGPGDEVRIEFQASTLPPLAPGWTRRYVVRSFGYCKDADPFTATSDTIEPLPWRTMPAFPFGAGVKRPSDPAYETYLRTYQIRPGGGGN
jgi:tetratricopeptide (TPR) repeat protein